MLKVLQSQESPQDEFALIIRRPLNPSPLKLVSEIHSFESEVGIEMPYVRTPV